MMLFRNNIASPEVIPERILTSAVLQAPEIQTMYNLPMPVANIRTRIRQEFERQRYVSKLPVADVLIFKSHAEYQVRIPMHRRMDGSRGQQPLTVVQEMMNFWKQTTHVMSYFKEENFRGDKRLPSSFITGFLEVRSGSSRTNLVTLLTTSQGRN